MDTERMRNTARWFYETVFREEAIIPRRETAEPALPSQLAAARSLESGLSPAWQSREALFIKQGKLLADFEDNCPYEREVVRYFPTYQSLTDRELRGYFTWRGAVRRGDVRKTSLSYAFLYIYELLNQIGVDDPQEGWSRLTRFRDSYLPLDGRIGPYLEQWLLDYVVYYELDPAPVADSRKIRFDSSLWALEDVRKQPKEAVVAAVETLAPGWLGRSKFYRENREEMGEVIVRVLRQMDDHYEKRCKKTLTEQYFGPYDLYPVRLFDSAVFYDRSKGRTCAVQLDEVRIYHCQSGLWSVQKYGCPERPSRKLEDLMKAIDCAMRRQTEYRQQIKSDLDTKWLLKLIDQTVQAVLEEKRAAEAKKIRLDPARLAAIRRDAEVTRDRLIVEEEAMEEELPPPAPVEEAPDTPLEGEEYRLLQCLLYGRPIDWVRSQGLLLSVLVDGINEKLFDTFADTVLTCDEPPQVLEDYEEELKGMVHP